jgi:hypothetical protein
MNLQLKHQEFLFSTPLQASGVFFDASKTSSGADSCVAPNEQPNLRFLLPEFYHNATFRSLQCTF